MREVVLDTETTGLDPKAGHRVVEIGCVELINHVETEETFHYYLNPDRDMPPDAFAIHGLSGDFLSRKPRFEDIADKLLAFLGDSPLVIHNASFDLGFLNAELTRVGRPGLSASRAIDTVQLARSKFPGSPANLDALCKRFQIDNSDRDLHGALLDSRLLARVYLELLGGRQPGLALSRTTAQTALSSPQRDRVHPPRPHFPSPTEAAAHAQFLDSLTNPLWRV